MNPNKFLRVHIYNSIDFNVSFIFYFVDYCFIIVVIITTTTTPSPPPIDTVNNNKQQIKH